GNSAWWNRTSLMNTASFSPAVRDILSGERLPALGPGKPNEPLRAQLAALRPDQLVAPEPVRRADFAQACLAALWLHHDFLDESHRISQEIHTTSGSYWHGILHRREPDPSNAAYWFQRVGDHPVFAPLAEAATEIAAGQMAIPSPWDPFWFIDFCEACRTGKEPGEELARLLQLKEWELLFGY